MIFLQNECFPGIPLKVLLEAIAEHHQTRNRKIDFAQECFRPEEQPTVRKWLDRLETEGLIQHRWEGHYSLTEFGQQALQQYPPPDYSPPMPSPPIPDPKESSCSQFTDFAPAERKTVKKF